MAIYLPFLEYEPKHLWFLKRGSKECSRIIDKKAKHRYDILGNK